MQGAVTITVRYGAQRQQFGPAEGLEIAVLDYSSQQLKLMPMLATCYALHFTAAFLVEQYAQAKRTKEEELVADVHSLSAGQRPPCAVVLAILSSCKLTGTMASVLWHADSTYIKACPYLYTTQMQMLLLFTDYGACVLHHTCACMYVACVHGK